MISITYAQDTIDSWKSQSTKNLSNRLLDALNDLNLTSGKGLPDVAVLIRQVLRLEDCDRESILGEKVTESSLVLPKLQIFERFSWSQYGLECIKGAQGGLKVSAYPWHPEWMDDIDLALIDRVWSRNKVILNEEGKIQVDPFMNETHRNLQHYRSLGQKQSVRSSKSMPPGSTLLINLPTGEGKTLAITSAVMTVPSGKTSFVVVPTVSLAIDQERRFAELSGENVRTAYHSGLTEGEKRQFRRRIDSGEQRVVFASPEALLSSLSPSIIRSAEGGRLALLAIDEAHVMASWGEVFRPHFQMLSGLRRRLIKVVTENSFEPFKTILTSATVTDEVLDLLMSLFGDPGPFYQVAAPRVRSEISFWMNKDLRSDERNRNLIDAMRHLPRPSIIYTTLRADEKAPPNVLTPKRVKNLLSEAGFTRIAIVDGRTENQDREEIIKNFRENSSGKSKYDVVIATSAFGLGIDVPDIRSILHACIPESIDRYYQEVGRSGRDGLPSVALLLATKEDLEVAESISTQKIITKENAIPRWNAMLEASETVENQLTQLPITARAQSLKRDSEKNREWNLKTLNLLARSRMIEWSFADLAGSDFLWATINIINPSISDIEVWDKIVEPTRVKLKDEAKKSLDILISAMGGKECIGSILARYYSISTPEDYRVICSELCGGCPHCRKYKIVKQFHHDIEPPAIEVRDSEIYYLDRYASTGRYGRRLTIYAGESQHSKRSLISLISNCIHSAGVRLVVCERPLYDTVLQLLDDNPPLKRLIMLDRLEEYSPLTAIGVRTLFMITSEKYSEAFVAGNSRVALSVIFGYEMILFRKLGMHIKDFDGALEVKEIQMLLKGQ